MMMTFEQYIQNPMGIANAVISNRVMYRDLYYAKFNNIMVREMGHMEHTLYKGKNKYYIHFKVPSEVIDKFYYDVVVEFTPPKDKKTMDNTLENYTVRFYSNDPSFVYTFAHAFIKNDMFIKDLTPVMSKQAIKKVAEEKNPNNQVGYVKSLYFAYIMTKKLGLFNKLKWGVTRDIDFKRMMKEITPADLKIEQRQDAQKKKSADKKAADAYLKKVARDAAAKESPIMIGKSKRIGGVKTTGKVRSTNRIKKTKKM